MGFPMIQLVMIGARQISKPIADKIISYGKDHPGFRNRVLIPIGRGLVTLTTRVRMKQMNLAKPTSIAQVSEETALQQASDFVQQCLIFAYSSILFAGYYGYTKWTTSETLKVDEFEEFVTKMLREKEEHLDRIKRLEDAITKAKIKLPPLPERKEEEGTGESPQPAAPNTTSTTLKEPVPTPPGVSPTPRFPLVSSLDLDTASHVEHEGEVFLVACRGTSLSFERGAEACERSLHFRIPPARDAPSTRGILRAAEMACSAIVGEQAQ